MEYQRTVELGNCRLGLSDVRGIKCAVNVGTFSLATRRCV